MGRLYGGVGAGPATYLPPRVSFLGVRSLSLVFADFATLLVFVFVFIFVLCFFFVPRCNHRWLWEDQDSCQGCEMTELLHKQLPLFRLDVAIESLFPELYGPVEARRRRKVRIHIEAALVHFGAAQASVLHTYWLCVRTAHRHLFVGKRRGTQTRGNATVTKTFFARGSQIRPSAMPSFDNSAFAHDEETCLGSTKQFNSALP